MPEQPVIQPRRKGRTGTQSMLIPTQQMVAEKLREAPSGQLSDLGGLRKALAVRVRRRRLLSGDGAAPYAGHCRNRRRPVLADGRSRPALCQTPCRRARAYPGAAGGGAALAGNPVDGEVVGFVRQGIGKP